MEIITQSLKFRWLTFSHPVFSFFVTFTDWKTEITNFFSFKKLEKLEFKSCTISELSQFEQFVFTFWLTQRKFWIWGFVTCYILYYHCDKIIIPNEE